MLDTGLRKPHHIISPGPFRFANAGRPARTGIIRRIFLTQSHYFPSPGQPGLATVYPDEAPAEPRLSPRPGIALVVAGTGRGPVYRNTAVTHRVYNGIKPRQSYGNAPVLPRS
ncbi:hypothetical protein DPMN_026609 [Dreissena polymorpha]|uniref:Uncharacterized protein n=1 Tax=Dreissena polymorpha TaxID=45954 RepID=A0A9D4LVI9_DREPO|nr:hypothetical protein DPMN_026609 [Dreissena polymorpha]